MPNSKEEIRKEATESAEDDLTKDIKHLLIDVHDELLQQRGGGNPFIKNLMHAQKRLASLIVRASIENDKLQQQIGRLTKYIFWFTIALFFIGIVSISPFLKEAFLFLSDFFDRIFCKI